MAKTYKGTLSLEWYNKQKSILLLESDSLIKETDIPAPVLNWVNKDEALFYEINEKEGKGVKPYWVDKNDIRVKEARPLILQKVYKAIEKDETGSIPGTKKEFIIKESKQDDSDVDNILIKGDNLLALNTLKKMFDIIPDDEKIKCIYIDPPYNTGSAFEHYDDNLAISEWLTLFRDRVEVLHKLLRSDGCILIQIDDECVNYAKSVLDEMFGRDNFITTLVVKMSHTSGVKMSHADKKPPKLKEYILFYAKNKESLKINPIYESVSWDDALDRYTQFILNKTENFEKWQVKPVNQIIKEEGIDINNDEETSAFKIKNADKIFRTARFSGSLPDEINFRKIERGKFYKIKTKTGLEKLIFNNEEVLFASEKIRTIDNIISPVNILGDLWLDIGINNLHNEGGVEFKNGKKPEKLIRRIIELTSSEGDIIMDCFGGSGTTFAMAQILKRRWIGVEIGKQCETHITHRLKNILINSEQGVVSQSLKWKGGGSFKYYHLGPSIIDYKKDGTIDFNWSLGIKFIEESFLSSYDYSLVQEKDLLDNILIKDKENTPCIGIQKIGSKSRVAIVSLNEPKGKMGMITYDEITNLYEKVKEKFSPEYINIFTNKGIDIASDSKPDDLEVIKIPHAIFSELEK